MTERESFTPEKTTEQLSPTEVLHSIIDTQRAPSPEYQFLIRGQEGSVSREHSDNFVDHWHHDLSSRTTKDILNDCLRNYLADKILVDLGGGQGEMGDIAHDFGASTYINVERAPYDETEAIDPSTPIEHQRKENFLSLRVHADMLDFVSRLRDGSIDNFVINGIDTYIIDNPRYHDALVKEILRATKKGGLIFGRSSDVLEDMERHVQACEYEKRPIDLPVRLMEHVEFSNSIFFEKTE
jgi:hypothetical protein